VKNYVKVIILILLVSIVTGCQREVVVEEITETINEQKQEQEQEQEQEPAESSSSSNKIENADFSAIISLSDTYNTRQFEGFTKNQLKQLEEQGFLVLGPDTKYPFLKMHEINEFAEYSEIPQFISTDVVLHLYHVFYSESMKGLEKTEYYPDLRSLTLTMFDKSLVLYEKSKTEKINQEALETLESLLVYFGVAKNILGDSVDTAQLPTSVGNLIKEELQAIEGAEGVSRSNFFEKDVDYSQYIVRGHYTLHEDLSRYFKGMMWYGQTGLVLSEGLESSGTVYLKQVRKAMLMTYLLQLPSEEAMGVDNNLLQWLKIYELTQLYSGSADDLTVLDIQGLIETVYGNDVQLEMLFDKQYDKAIIQGVFNLRSPKVIQRVANPDIDMPVGKEFRFMGQRYTLDGFVMQELMEPILRPVPTSLDVITAFGHEHAEAVLREFHQTDEEWPGYNERLAGLKDQINAMTDEHWQQDMYHGWLWGIDAAATSFVERNDVPYFMSTKAWGYKNLATAIGSYSELKHDNVLYSKQPVAEMGGPMYEPLNYVEPNVLVFSRLLWLTNYTLERLIEKGVTNEEVLEPLQQVVTMMETLETVAKKELAGEFITTEENRQISHIGGLVDYLTYSLGYAWSKDGDGIAQRNTTSLISDIATILEYGYVELGVGLPSTIYVLVEVNDVKFIARGAVFSPYEFISSKRLTNELWEEMLGISSETFEYGTIPSYDASRISIDLFETMPWLLRYMSDEPNDITISPVEFQWGFTND
jgi:hypothetical protein